MISINKQQEGYYYYMGTHLGYPACCTKQFILKLQGLDNTLDYSSPLVGTGFVPCKECGKDTNKTLDFINKNRQVSTVFPKHTNRELEELKIEWHKGVENELKTITNRV